MCSDKFIRSTQCSVRHWLLENSFYTAVSHWWWPCTCFKKTHWSYWSKMPFSPKQRRVWCLYSKLWCCCCQAVFWTFDGTHEDEKMIWFGSRALQNQVMIRTSNTAKSVFCMTKKCVKQGVHAWFKKQNKTKKEFVKYQRSNRLTKVCCSKQSFPGV